MESETKLRRAAVVVNTTDGQRLKPACPICNAVSWARPRPNPEEGSPVLDVQPVVTAMRGEELMSLPVQMFICQNCGFVWHVAMNVDRGHQVGGDE